MIFSLRRSGWTDLPIILVALTVFSQPFGVAFELFTLIMAILGVRHLIINDNHFRRSSGVKCFTLLFSCFWVPAVFSLPDAYMFKKDAIDTLGMLRFYFAGVFIINAASSVIVHERIARVVAAIIIFWMVDAWVQFVFSVGIFGIASYSSDRISGLFGDDPILGWMLVVYMGIAAAAVYQWIGKVGLLIILPILVATIFISGNRGAWLAVAWVLLFVVIIAALWKVSLSKRAVLGGILIMSLGIAGLSTNEGLKERIAFTFQGLGDAADYASLDRSTAYRLTLWGTAVNMIEDNWINGVGLKSFRYAYPDYAEPDDFFILRSPEEKPKTGAFHGHQIVIDALAGTGLFGFIGLLVAFWLVFWRFFWQVVKIKQWIPMGYYCGMVGVLFPINTHLSLYKAYWAQAFWLLAALLVASLVTYAREVSDDTRNSSLLDES
jgi:O-antigen ligase